MCSRHSGQCARCRGRRDIRHHAARAGGLCDAANQPLVPPREHDLVPRAARLLDERGANALTATGDQRRSMLMSSLVGGRSFAVRVQYSSWHERDCRDW
jgi:hypothetical protein